MAISEDLDSIADIESEAFVNPWTRENYANELNIPFSYLIVAERDNIIDGFALVWMIEDEAHLNKIAVRSSSRRLGIAGFIIDNITEKAVSGEMKVVFLEVREKNAIARNFYKKHGFVENGFRKNYYPDDNAVLIEKRL